ncbi:RES family NAD+ phosphorylase [Lunatimonas sp.]|uniref:RES family NAD+ phosphorylase n=1 Tax=Lunatimonas sp. TaxID=2060141 RepID=UPI00263B0033|nr:RES family NAD+ phosphorylase [Lunatimonas sp.]
MLRYYRMMSERYHQAPYSSSLSGGRWNPKGLPMIYAASSAALAALEYLCIKGTSVGADPWFVIVYEIPSDRLIGTLERSSLPENWDVLPHGKATQDFGRQWLMQNAFPFLQVPSARLHESFYPEEHNLLINPSFPGMQELLRVVDTRKFAYKLGG